ncbi:MAG: type II toxin-antitoxin system VapC family toxin [Thermoanaerobaculia bacterium]
MAVVYFDSSAFVKLLVDEEGSDLAAQLWDGCDAAVSSRLAYPEVRAALAAAARDGRLERQAHETAEADWEEFWSATRVIEMSEAVAQHAGGLAQEYALRGADAVHLASALALGTNTVVLAVWDTRLRLGAEAAGLRIAPA